MTRTQTALYTWTAPDGTPRYLIDPAEWQDGQPWTRASGSLFTTTMSPQGDGLGLVWVRELLPIPLPLPEVHWIDGHPVTFRSTLPRDTRFQMYVGGTTFTKGDDHTDQWPVIVVAWPDGTKPERPTVDGAR